MSRVTISGNKEIHKKKNIIDVDIRQFAQ